MNLGYRKPLYMLVFDYRSSFSKGLRGSMPPWELFERQGAEYREGVLPRAVKARLAVGAARSLGWKRWVGSDVDILSVDRIGASAQASW
jgi:transketolase